MAARPDTHPEPTAPAPARTARPPLPTYPGPAYPERLPNATPRDDDAAKDAWLDRTAREHITKAERSIDASDMLLAGLPDGAFRNQLQRQRDSWAQVLDAAQQRPYRTVRMHVAANPDQPHVVTLLRFRADDARYDVAQRIGRGPTMRLHSYGYRDDAERQFEQLTRLGGRTP